MLYLILKETWESPTLLDVTYPIWKLFNIFDSNSIVEAIENLPNDREAKYVVYELTRPGINVSVRKPNKFEKVYSHETPKG